jgi:uroporphyrinogen decarboxylase
LAFNHPKKESALLPRERVIRVIQHQKPDRIPIYGWVRANLEKEISQAFGSVEAFEDHYEFDLAHIFGGPGPYPNHVLHELRQTSGAISPRELLDIPLNDPNNASAYQNIANSIKHHKEQRGRFVYVQTPGIFECLNGPFGIENHLMYLALYEQDLHEVYKRQSEWNRTFANNCIDLGIDMVHISDDWGGQKNLLFSPNTWKRLIYPYHKTTCEHVLKRGSFLSFHSDGNINQVLDGIVDLGFHVIHPYQESAGMDYQIYKKFYSHAFVLMGGLDVQTTIGFGKRNFLTSEIERVMRLFVNGGLLYCTSHYVQNHCTIEELTLAFDTVYELSRKLTAES